MPKIKAKVLATKVDENGRMLAKIQCNEKLPPLNAPIEIRYGSKRSLAQNAFLWTYYTWLINHAGMTDHGFFCPEALHVSLKAHFLAEKIMSRGEFKAIEEGSTATLNKLEFGQYIEKIDNFIVDFFGIDTSPFWEEYEKDWKV